jgi:NAD(P)-dependent dehydrogenase (short-subunit alcohol dehydrogenase family)
MSQLRAAPGCLEGRCALITGGSRGIGRAIALALARAGAHVVVNFNRHAEDAGAVVAEVRQLGRTSGAVQGDTSIMADVTRLVGEAETILGKIDLLVNNAGVLERAPFLNVTEELWDRTLAINLKGYFLVGQAVARRMADSALRGTIVNVSSAIEALAAPNATPYAVSKAGVAMLTKQMALELAPHGIRVNSVCPGLVATDLNRLDLAEPEFRRQRLARIPLAEIGAPDDVAGAVVFLSSATDSRLVTGASIYIDGGKSIWSG